jgi:hypothetical protein
MSPRAASRRGTFILARVQTEGTALPHLAEHPPRSCATARVRSSGEGLPDFFCGARVSCWPTAEMTAANRYGRLLGYCGRQRVVWTGVVVNRETACRPAAQRASIRDAQTASLASRAAVRRGGGIGPIGLRCRVAKRVGDTGSPGGGARPATVRPRVLTQPCGDHCWSGRPAPASAHKPLRKSQILICSCRREAPFLLCL